MTQVDPFVIPIPKALLADPEVRFYHEYLNKFLHDLWIRTGGGNDAISDTGIRELYPYLPSAPDESVFGVYGGVSRGTDDVSPTSFYSFQRPTVEVEIISVSADYTTTGDQIIICTNTSSITVTLNPNPADGEEVHIKRQNTGVVTIVGDIDGQTSITPVLRYDSPHLVYTIEANEWSIV